MLLESVSMADGTTTTTGGGPTNPNPLQSQPEPESPVPKSEQLPPPPPPPPSQHQLSNLPPSLPQTSNPTTPATPPVISKPQSVRPFAPPAAPSFRPPAAPPPVPPPTLTPQFTPLPTFPNYQSPGVQPPGVGSLPPPAVLMPPVVSGAGDVAVSSLPQRAVVPYATPGQPPNLTLGPYAPLPNGYPVAQGTMPGIPRYSFPYQPMVWPAFLARPPGAVGILPPLSRPPVPFIRSPIIPPVVRPVIPSIARMDKPQTTVYIGKLASTVDNDFMLSVLELCGAVKSWMRAQDPTSGALKGFGFCEFESAEGVLRALRLLTKLNVDGQELMLKVDLATKEYLHQYVNEKTKHSKNVKVTETEDTEKEPSSDAEENEPIKPSEDDSKKDDSDAANKDKNDNLNFGLVTDQDREADREASGKLLGMIEGRFKARPLPPPPPLLPTADGSGDSNSELPSKSRDGDSDVDIVKKDTAKDKNDDEMTSEGKSLSEHEEPETSTPDPRSKERGRELKWEKERELERYEREREQHRAKREREREYKIREDERGYKLRVKEWESRERENEHMRKTEKERKKEREQERKWEIDDQERESDDGYSRKRKCKSSGEERKRRQRKKEEDLADRLKEEEEIAEAKRKEDKERELQKQQEKEALKVLSAHANNGSDKAMITDDANAGSKDKACNHAFDGNSSHGLYIGDAIIQNGHGDEPVMGSIPTPDSRHIGNGPTKKFGFGLVGSGKRAAAPCVFHVEEDEDAHKDKKMRPLVPIDYSTEELQAVQPSVSGAPSPNLVAAAEFAKRISNVNVKEERPDTEKERRGRSDDKYSHWDQDRGDEETNHTREKSRKETVNRDNDRDKLKRPNNQKLLDAKQLIDMIPKTKDQLFSHEINWSIYDKNQLHERMRPWISKKITEFLGEEETTLGDYIVSSTQEHVLAAEMLDRLQTILDDEAEMFVLKMWRMLIFEIKRVEIGLALRSKAA